MMINEDSGGMTAPPSTPQEWVGHYHKIALAELRIWRTLYPDRAGFVAEEAAAKVENRDPRFGPPIVRI